MSNFTRNEFRQIYGDDAPFVHCEADPPPIELPVRGDIAFDANAYTSLEEFECQDKRLHEKYLELVVAEFGEKARQDPLQFAGPQRYALQLMEDDSGSDGEPVASSSRQTRQKKSKAKQASPSNSEDDAVPALAPRRRPSEAPRTRLGPPRPRPVGPRTAPVIEKPLAELVVGKHSSPLATASGADDSQVATRGQSDRRQSDGGQSDGAVEVDNSDLFNEDEDDTDGPPETSIADDEDEEHLLSEDPGLRSPLSPLSDASHMDVELSTREQLVPEEGQMRPHEVREKDGLAPTPDRVWTGIDNEMPSQGSSLDVNFSVASTQHISASYSVASDTEMLLPELLSDSEIYGPQQGTAPAASRSAPPPSPSIVPSPPRAPTTTQSLTPPLGAADVHHRPLHEGSTAGTSVFC